MAQQINELLVGCGGLSGGVREEDTFKILVASDIHLGYCDNNPARENDSFVTFEEILQLGRDENVDFVLLGGDLFHENKPKPATLHRAMEIMRRQCLGTKAIEFDYLGDPKLDFPNQDQPEINYLNPDINVALPVFTIHGNHDDPVGAKKTSAVDHLVAAKLLNHFGQWDDLNQINIRAVPLMKGETRIALFGLGNLKDERLYRLISNKDVSFTRPRDNSTDEWFNIFVLHQNRVKRGQEAKNYIPESFIPQFFDVVVWGHEHECRIKPEPSNSEDSKTYIIQPGSPVATSLCSGESREKHVGMLYINKRKFRLEERKLKTVRPMLLMDIALRDVLPNLSKEEDPGKVVEKYVTTRVTSLLEDVHEQLTGHPLQPMEPLVRVRIFHENVNESFNPVRFAQKFAKKITNEDIVMFKRTPGGLIKGENGELDIEEMDELFKHVDDPDLDSHVESIVEAFFAKARENGDEGTILEVLGEKGLSEAVKNCVEKDDKDSLTLIIDKQTDRIIEHLMRKECAELEDIEAELKRLREHRWAHPEEEEQEAQNLLKSRPVKKRSSNNDDDEDEDANGSDNDNDNDVSLMMDDDDGDDGGSKSSKGGSKRGRGARGGRGSRSGGGATTGRGRGRGRGKTTAAISISGSDDESPATTKSKRGGGVRGRGRGSKADNSRSSDGKPLVQTKLNLQVRRSPRKGAMTFDVSDDSD